MTNNIFSRIDLICPLVQQKAISRIPKSKEDIFENNGKRIEGRVLIHLTEHEISKAEEYLNGSYEKKWLELESKRLAYIYFRSDEIL